MHFLANNSETASRGDFVDALRYGNFLVVVLELNKIQRETASWTLGCKFKQ